MIPIFSKYPIHDLLKRRSSPRAFSSKAVPKDVIMTIVEAARWAPSSFNLQPWRFLIFDGSDIQALNKAESTLLDGNAWAKTAPVLIATMAKRITEEGKENAYAEHDLGLATENLLLQATAMGLSIHPMSGFHRSQMRQLFSIPEKYEIMALIALGYPGDYKKYPEEISVMDNRERKRKELEQIAYFNHLNQ